MRKTKLTKQQEKALIAVYDAAIRVHGTQLGCGCGVVVPAETYYTLIDAASHAMLVLKRT